MKLRLALLILLLPFTVIAQNVNIIPQPASLTLTKSKFVLKQGTAIITKDASLTDEARYLKKQLYSSNKIQVNLSKTAQHGIILKLTNDKDTTGSYHLVISNQNVLITASTKEGIFYGI